MRIHHYHQVELGCIRSQTIGQTIDRGIGKAIDQAIAAAACSAGLEDTDFVLDADTGGGSNTSATSGVTSGIGTCANAINSLSAVNQSAMS
jgi:hypothetical protein